MKALIGIKKGMTRIFVDDKVVPVTIIDTQGCVLSHIEPEGFELGIGEKKHPNKAMQGKYKALKRYPVLRKYFKGSVPEEFKPGEEINAEIFSVGDKVTVSGVSKGKGFAGVVKRWGFKGGPKTHGQSDNLRAPGSIGAGTDPGRVFKGKKMPGRMGGEKVTLKGRKVIAIQDSIILIAGPIPGSRGDMIAIFEE
jgi:large subunit ribosomal protein L3